MPYWGTRNSDLSTYSRSILSRRPCVHHLATEEGCDIDAWHICWVLDMVHTVNPRGNTMVHHMAHHMVHDVSPCGAPCGAPYGATYGATHGALDAARYVHMHHRCTMKLHHHVRHHLFTFSWGITALTCVSLLLHCAARCGALLVLGHDHGLDHGDDHGHDHGHDHGLVDFPMVMTIMPTMDMTMAANVRP